MNTEIKYTYRDGSNYQKPQSAVVSGEIDAGQKRSILASLMPDGLFAAEAVGLPAERFETITEDDHGFMELNGFELTSQPASVDLTISELAANFERCADHWEELAADIIWKLYQKAGYEPDLNLILCQGADSVKR